ncbi:hypothetical protein CASFOL_031742 [Castilleja foliolosa]|uniref:Uncharacterized protein n=1 Tax=Castilleja foliolosa TaxID=1961234 RepID=A0ABD3C6X9_9LAMI
MIKDTHGQLSKHRDFLPAPPCTTASKSWRSSKTAFLVSKSPISWCESKESFALLASLASASATIDNWLNRWFLTSQRLRGGGAERKGKRRVWISLSKEEFGEDIYAFNGGKPARRPKKWPRNVQKRLEISEIFDVDMEVGESKWFVYCNGNLVKPSLKLD